MRWKKSDFGGNFALNGDFMVTKLIEVMTVMGVLMVSWNILINKIRRDVRPPEEQQCCVSPAKDLPFES